MIRLMFAGGHHQLDGHEQHHAVPPREDAVHAAREHERAEEEGGGDGHGLVLPREDDRADECGEQEDRDGFERQDPRREELRAELTDREGDVEVDRAGPERR